MMKSEGVGGCTQKPNGASWCVNKYQLFNPSQYTHIQTSILATCYDVIVLVIVVYKQMIDYILSKTKILYMHVCCKISVLLLL